MMKFLFFMLFMLPICLINNKFWMVQNMLLLLTFIWILSNNFSFHWMMISYFMGCDMLPYGLILLSLWICFLMIMASEPVYKFNMNEKLFIINLISLMLFLFLTFSSMNLFMFYLFFESSLTPTLFLILGWGYQSERLQAGMYLLFYTLLVSLPMLIGIFWLYFNFNFLYFYMMNLIILLNNELLYFLVKTTMFFVHLWLPKAHVKAPVSGSMILAGIMLKLGGYGLLRILMVLKLFSMK